MREIKFRGFGKDAKRWIYGSLLDERSVGIVAIQDDACHVWEVDPESVGQYTGLLGSNGKEIYEGDIIEVNSGCCVKDGVRTDFIFHSVVFWYKSGFMHKGPGIFSDSFNNVKVIGNVHDNPDLLEAAHD